MPAPSTFASRLRPLGVAAAFVLLGASTALARRPMMKTLAERLALDQ